MNSHNHQSSPQNTLNPLTTRPYQDEAVDITVDHTTSLVRQSLERLDHGTFETAGLLEMATGTGKTFTVGKYVEEIIELRDRFNAIYHTNKFQ